MSEQITQTEIIQRILACKAALGLDTLPNTDDLKKVGINWNLVRRVGGLQNLSEMTGIPMKPRQTSYKKQSESYIDRTPVREADLKNWSAERQKAETLRMVGSIDTSVYGVEKVRAL